MTTTDPPVPVLAHLLFFAEPDPGRRTPLTECPYACGLVEEPPA